MNISTHSTSSHSNVTELFPNNATNNTMTSENLDSVINRNDSSSFFDKPMEFYQRKTNVSSNHKNMEQSYGLSYNIDDDGHKYNTKTFKVSDNMEKVLEKYIDKMDRDQSDLRNDIRASEDRIAKSIELSETRNSEKLNNIESMIKDHFNKIDDNYNKLEDKIDNNNKFITSISITTILGIAAMVITIIALVITIILTLQNLPQ